MSRLKAWFLVLASVSLLSLPVSGSPSSVFADEASEPVVEFVPWDAGIFGKPQTAHAVDLGEYGYVEEEYFISGTARSYTDPPATAPYTTRFIVRRPLDSDVFNGTVVVEWNNVTAQFDNTPDWTWARPMLLREGFAYAAVSAQRAGHDGDGPSLKRMDPVRYEALSHPGDDYSFDMFSQVVRVLRGAASGGVDPMGSLVVERVVAVGHSQSAGRLKSYHEIGAHEDVGAIDAFLIDGGGSKTWGAGHPAAPVIQIQEEHALTPAEPVADATHHRLWEVVGTSHMDYWGFRQAFDAPGVAIPHVPQHTRAWAEAEDEVVGNYGYDLEARQFACTAGGNMYQKRYVVSAAIYRLDEWVRTGLAAPSPPRPEFDVDGRLVRDPFGNARGGLRMPFVDVPVATYAVTWCSDNDIPVPFTYGITIPLDPETLGELYPTTADYVLQMQEATDAAVAAGVLLPEDAADVMRRASSSSIPSRGVQSPLPPVDRRGIGG